MPLVFAVIVLVGVFVISKDSIMRNNRTLDYAKTHGYNKTNAGLEYKLVKAYQKQGLSLDEAFRRSYEDMAKAGYSPCIPKDFYKSYNECEYRARENYDSFVVKSRREAIEKQWKRREYTDEDIDREIYKNFPTSYHQYIADIDRTHKIKHLIDAGEYITHPDLGVCEIISNDQQSYKVKVLSSGKIAYIRVDDKRIRHK